MRSEFDEWYEKWTGSKVKCENYDVRGAWQHQQSKVSELQKRVDAAKYYMKNIFSGDAEVDQCHLGDMLDILDGKIVDELEQALKGGFDHE